MNYSVSLETKSSNTAGELSSTSFSIDSGKNGALSFLKKGQQISGIVESVLDQVTINFNGHKVKTSKDVFEEVAVGDVKTFEVIKASGKQIELKPIAVNANSNLQAGTVTMIKDIAKDSILAAKKMNEKQALEKEKEIKGSQNKLEEISTKLTGEDCKNIEAGGFAAESMTVDSLYGATNRAKENGTSTQSPPSKVKNAQDRTGIINRLVTENLPVTEENIAKVTKALELSGTSASIDDKAIQYLIATNTEPTIENVYKACYSNNNGKQESAQVLSEQTWKDLEPQAKEIITEAGYEVSDENLSDAKWIVENNLPLTKETFTYKKELKEIQNGVSQEDAMNKIMTGMKEGIAPKDVSLAPEDVTDYAKVLSDLESISTQAIEQAVRENADITIKQLATIQLSIATGTDQTKSSMESEIPVDYQYEAVKAQRQLEEIRLKMTLESAAQLEKKGFSIETEKLEKVVTALKELEDSYYKKMLQESEVDATDLEVQTLKETTQSLAKLQYMPNYVLGTTLSERSTATIPSLLTEGAKLQANLTKAGMAYETLMTTPNSEYGDSIKKAFNNMDSLLAEMNIDNTEQNQKAVRILGYNQMEITEESINQVKAYNLEVTSMIENLHPAVTVWMIKSGINPLDMSIKELNQTIDTIKAEQGITSEEKYSTYLQKLDKTEELTQEERKAYVGVYRLLYNVEQSDGAALGAVINSGREITLDHLLSAVRTGKKGSIDAVIDDEFGILESTTKKGETITDQIGTVFNNETSQQNGQESESSEMAAEQAEYIDRILKQLKEELSPDKLQQAGQIMSETAAVPSEAAGTNIWKTIKDVPVEKLLEQMKKAEGNDSAEAEIYAQKAEEIRELCKNSEQSLKFLNDFKVPATPLNIMMANQVLSNGESVIKKILNKQNEQNTENKENNLTETGELSDTLIDKASMNEAYEKLETEAKDALTQACSSEIIDSRKLAELKSTGQQMTFLRNLAQKEFYQIPIETEGGVTNMNLTILRGTESSGKVSIATQSDQLGSIKADFSLNGQTLKGFITCDSQQGLESLQSNIGEIEKTAEEDSVIIKQMDFGTQRKDKDAYSYPNSDSEAQGASMNADTERILYRLAKAVVQTVRLAENSMAREKAVS